MYAEFKIGTIATYVHSSVDTHVTISVLLFTKDKHIIIF